jgi:hypothetical protein
MSSAIVPAMMMCLEGRSTVLEASSTIRDSDNTVHLGEEETVKEEGAFIDEDKSIVSPLSVYPDSLD